MSGEGYRVLLECRRRSEALREKGFSYDQIADVLALDHDVSPLRLLRYAHGRTASDVVAAFNELDRAGTASLREARLYDYESGTRRPSAPSIVAFARLYLTTGRRLLTEDAYQAYNRRDRGIIDLADYRTCQRARPRVTVEETGEAQAGGVAAHECAELLRAVNATEADVKRRELLFELGLALGGVPALTLLGGLTPEEQERLARTVQGQFRIDAHAIQTIETLTAKCRHLDDTHGPASVFPVVDRQREVVAGLLKREPLQPSLRDRLTIAYAELSQLSGYLHHDLMDYPKAEHRLADGLRAALDVGDAGLAAYIHSWLGAIAVHRGRPARAADHTHAAAGWIGRRGGLLAAMNESVRGGVHAHNGTADGCRRAVDRAKSFAAAKASSDPSYLYWLSPSMIDSKAVSYYVQLKQPAYAMSAAENAMANLDATFQLDRAFGLIQRAEAMIYQREIPEAAASLREANSLMAGHDSARLSVQFRTARAHLEPWAANAYVRALDEQTRTT